MYSFKKFNMRIFKSSLYDFFNIFVVSVFPISNTVNLFQNNRKKEIKVYKCSSPPQQSTKTEHKQNFKEAEALKVCN